VKCPHVRNARRPVVTGAQWILQGLTLGAPLGTVRLLINGIARPAALSAPFIPTHAPGTIPETT
jgi:hypothetical protein